MVELKQTFNHHGMKAFMAPAAQKVLQAIADLDVRQTSETGAREGDLLQTLDLFFNKGLLQKKTPPSSLGQVQAAG